MTPGSLPSYTGSGRGASISRPEDGPAFAEWVLMVPTGLLF
ncbi:MAG: hypothetical protein JWO38_4998 [Gemmataceae bacterium]|nr:hypothetical protein [Gemmataceae bacterium]